MENEEKNLNETTPQPDPEEVKTDEVGEEGEQGKEEDSKPTKQSQSQNAKYAQQRREAEAKAKAEKEARDKELQLAKEEGYRKGQIDATKTNPFTEEPIEDDYDFEIYQIQQELDKQGRDPIKELPRELARRRREMAKAEKEKAEEEAKSKQEAETKRQETLERKRKEISEVEKKFKLSHEDMKKLLTEDSDFKKKLEEKEDRWTLEEIFEAYYKPKQEEPPQKRSTPSGGTGGSKVERSVKDMTDEEYIKYSQETYGGF